MQDILKLLKIECDKDVRNCEKASREQSLANRSKIEKPLIWLVLFMLAMTLFYMAWSINKIHDMHHSINSIHQEKSEADRKADLFFDAVKKKQRKV